MAKLGSVSLPHQIYLQLHRVVLDFLPVHIENHAVLSCAATNRVQ